MRKVKREEILDLERYDERRPLLRERVMFEKARRRIHVGEHLTFLFENHETIRYQVQEMLRVERRSAEEDVRHELETYNELLGDDGELGCTLLIEIDDAAERDAKLAAWLEMPKHLYLVREDGTRAPAIFDERQIGDDRLSSVQYLKFASGSAAPRALGCDLPGVELEVELTSDQRAALAEDLAS